MEMALRVKEQEGLEALEMFSIMAWSFGYKRNKWIHEKVCLDQGASIEHALSLHKCYKAVKPIPRSKLRKKGRWKAPPVEYLKLNLDVQIFVDNNKTRIKLILRDDHEACHLATSVAKEGVSEPEDHIELFAILSGMQICLGMSIRKIKVESDCCLRVKECQV